ncbi:anaphase-promoting complex subunit 4 [Prorops nasuta]|uniref:anaphase-promoting complex subunit 4 n=1 Tax=Prorops nasuta TaxID=863751 RepID=UPI0034CFAB0B
MSGATRQFEERQLPSEVTDMQWSPKMDLLAIANIKGEIALHRFMSWQRVWLLSPPGESDNIVNIAWRPDGKLMAACYRNSELLCLVDIENKNIVSKTNIVSITTVTCMTWLPLSSMDADNNLDSSKYNSAPRNNYLPTLPSLNRTFIQEPEHKEHLSHKLDILFIGQENGNIGMYVFGMFYCGKISIGHEPVLEISGILNGSMWITQKCNSGVNVNRFTCPLLEKSTAFLKVAQTQANVDYCMDYLSRTLMAISEAWETILLEMDEKLTRYAESNPPGAMAADFLELLMIGVASENLENFLLRDLTEKGLKKLGHSIEMCYSNIQKLVLKNLTSVGMALVYELSELRGMVRLGADYENLGMTDESIVTNALHATEAFLAKSSEIQQVIDHSMRDYNAFFRWLHVVISRLSDERVSPEVSRMSQQELTFIAEFLRGFDKTEPKSGGRKGVNLEKLGQYLRRQSLQTCLTPEGSEWAAMLDENHCLRDHPLIIKQDLSNSLMQSHSKVSHAINTVFTKSYQGLVSQFKSLSLLLELEISFSSQIITPNGNLMLAAVDFSRKQLKLFKVNCLSTETTSLAYQLCLINVTATDTLVADLQFYSLDYLSLLLVNQQNRITTLIQLPLNNITMSENDQIVHDLSEVIANSWVRPFEGLVAKKLAVSGERKVTAILSENNRKIRLLEIDDDDDEGLDENMDVTTSTTPTPSTAHSS